MYINMLANVVFQCIQININMDHKSTIVDAAAVEKPLESGSIEPQGVSSSASDSVDQPTDAVEEETRVITLDTIIRKGLIEQMPMTAKDINSIVALSMKKEREKQAADRIRLAALKSKQIDSDDNTDSSDYDSSNENDFETKVDPVKSPAAKNDVLPEKKVVIQKEPLSVIQRVPKDVRSQLCLADDLKNTQEDTEDFELKSGDLHYSESNPSDYSESENRLSSSQSSSKKRQAISRKRDLSPSAIRLVTPNQADESIKKQRIDPRASCTDSKRNAILLQCSSGFVGSTKPVSPKLSLVEDLSSKLFNPLLHIDPNESSDHSGDRSIDIESMLQVQHSMEEDKPPSNVSRPVEHQAQQDVQFAIKLERESPVEDMLEIHHIEEFRPATTQSTSGKSGRGGRKPKASFKRSTYSESTITPQKSTGNKRSKKTKLDTPAESILIQPESILPMIESVLADDTPTTSGTAKKRQTQKRDKRLSVRSNPVYAELSESSSDHLDAAALLRKSKPVVISANQTAAPATSATPKMHWKTQLKMQRQHNESISLIDKSSPSEREKFEVTKQANEAASGQLKESEVNNDQAHKHTMEDGTIINKIIEPPHNQKRIPKLKYGSFNFTERRGGMSKGPKMVLKYKKKYKKKPIKLQAQRLAAVEHSIIDEEGNLEPAALAVR